MIAALPVNETLDSLASFSAAAGVTILMLAAAAFISMLVFETVDTFRTFRALSKLT